MRKLFYITQSKIDANPEFTVTSMTAKERNEAIQDLDDGDKLIEFQYGKGAVDGYWCAIWGEPMESTADSCGTQCPHYNPRNGKSGCCRDLSPCVRETGRVFRKEND